MPVSVAGLSTGAEWGLVETETESDCVVGSRGLQKENFNFVSPKIKGADIQ